ncbi:hypothetical protein NL676_039493 [Syzygium grande]|nr:hypothetical protein NL676_039493 [Syzygium grande]
MARPPPRSLAAMRGSDPPVANPARARRCLPHLRRASLSVARRRSSDAARGLEPLPVPFLNAIDSRPYTYFLYAPSSFSRALSPPNDALLPLRQPWGSSSRTASRPTAFPSREAADVVVGGMALGCCCERCEGRDCTCWGGDGGGEEGEEEEVVVVSECGPGCGRSRRGDSYASMQVVNYLETANDAAAVSDAVKFELEPEFLRQCVYWFSVEVASVWFTLDQIR